MADTTQTHFRIGDPVPHSPSPTPTASSTASRQDAPPATVLVVTCNHCPYVIAWNPRLRAVAEDYAGRGVRFLGVHANDAARYPADSLEAIQRFVRDQSWPYPQLVRRGRRTVARALGAEVTPHVFVLDGEHRLAYRGAPDGDHQDAGARRGVAARRARRASLAAAPAEAETPPRGCSVKWRARRLTHFPADPRTRYSALSDRGRRRPSPHPA